MKVIKNDVYKPLSDFVKEHNGFGRDAFKKHPEIRIMEKSFMDQLKSLDGKRVKINFCYENDFINGGGEKTGRIKVATSHERDEHIRFFEGRKRNRFYYLDAGLYEGFYATLIPLKIEVLS